MGIIRGIKITPYTMSEIIAVTVVNSMVLTCINFLVT